ncbi:MAG: hypothetical protein Q8Q52_05260, partial [Acidimicrobiia bacterium]|nr:hypothetical protein [Acidimicrobiia bacterium]
MKVVWSPDLRLHDPSAEIWVGVRIPGTEVAARVDAIVDAVAGAGHDLIDPRPIGPGELEAVHAPDLVGFLRDAWSMWGHSPYIEEPGQDRVVPYVFPLPGLTSGRPPRRPTSVAALAGMFAIDTM